MVLISYFKVDSNSLPDDVHHVTEADILHGHFPREVLKQLHLVKRVTGLGEDEAAPGDDVAGGEADHGQGLLMMETGHPGLRLVTIRQQLGAETQTGDQDQGQAPEQGQPPASITLGPGQGCQHTQHCLTHDPCCVITPLVMSLLTLSYFLTGPGIRTGASVSVRTLATIPHQAQAVTGSLG